MKPEPAVGHSVSRKDGIGKATGAARYADDLVFPDITIAARNAWVAYGSKVRSAAPDPTLSRTFLAGVALK